MATPRIGSPGIFLPYPNTNSILMTDAITLSNGSKYLIPAGQFYVKIGPYTQLQTLDPVTQTWVEYGLPEDGYLQSDGVNFRLANLTGCMVGAIVTTSGTGYTTAPTVTAAAPSNAKFTAILGGMLSSTVTVATAGVGYNHPPTILIAPPTGQGVPATASCAVSSGTISSVTMINQGAGYTAAPALAASLPAGVNYNNTFGPSANTYAIVPDPNDTITTTAALTFGLVSGISSNVTAILCTDPGDAVTQLPSLTITAAPTGGTTAVATAIAMFTVTAITISAANAGSAYGTSSPFLIYGPGQLNGSTRATTAAGPITDTGLYQPQPFVGYGTSTSGGALTTAGFVISYGGLHQATPNLFTTAGGTTVPTLYGVATPTLGGVSDTSWLTQI